MKEQELTSRMSEVISNIRDFDEHTDYRNHQWLIQTAAECSAVVQEYNQLVRNLRDIIEQDPTKLPALIVEEQPKYEN